MNIKQEEFIKEVVKNKDSVHFEGIVRMLLTDLINSIDNPKEPEAVHGNEAEKEVCPKCKSNMITENYDKTRKKCIFCAYDWANDLRRPPLS